MKIYTRTGDDGTTGLYGGARVSKADPRVDAYGDVDETNAAIGFARAASLPPTVDRVLAQVQVELFEVGGALATPAGKASKVEVADADVAALEAAIDEAEATLEPLKTFVLPGGSEGACRLHLARTVCRRAERAVVTLARRGPVDPRVVVYLNRHSDLLFVLAREANHHAGEAEERW